MDIDSEVGEGFNDFDVVTGNWHKGAWEEGSVEGSVDRPVRTARTFVHHYNSTQSLSPDQHHISMWPNGDNREMIVTKVHA